MHGKKGTEGPSLPPVLTTLQLSDPFLRGHMKACACYRGCHTIRSMSARRSPLVQGTVNV